MKRLLLATLLLPIVLLLAGCGGGPNGEKKEDTGTVKTNRKEKTGD